VYTKLDQVPKNRREGALLRHHHALGGGGRPLGTSTLEGTGIDELRRRLHRLLAPPPPAAAPPLARPPAPQPPPQDFSASGSRSAAHADLDAISAIERASFASPWSPESLAAELDRPWSFFPVRCLPDGTLVAYLNYWVVFDEIHVLNLATHPAHRRAGHARALLAEMIGLGSQNGSRFVHLEVRASNAPAQRLYEALGFARVGRRPRYYNNNGEDAFLYRLDLAPAAGD
jgi:ribosomal-protein-alanine N-acetyltransferase